MLRPCLLFLTLSVVGLAGCSQHPASPTQPKEAVIAAGKIGSHLPDFSVKDFQGRAVSSADLRGKVVLIDFWATWCQGIGGTPLRCRYSVATWNALTLDALTPDLSL